MIKKRNSSKGVESEAIFSDCERYRYTLTRVWDGSLGKVMFIALNPSTADEMKNDPTVTRMIGYARSWGYGGVVVCNLFGFRATLPSDLKKEMDPVGRENDENILGEAEKVDRVIAAWGNHGVFMNRSGELKSKIKNLYHLGLSKIGEPKHPLYLRGDLEPSLLK